MRLLLLLLLTTPLAALDGVQQIGRGVKAHGVGGAAIAFAQDSMAQAANPANLMAISNRVDAGLYLIDDTWSEISGRLGWWGNQALGASIFVYGAMENPDYGAIFFSPAWGWAVSRRHSVGIAINLAWEWLDIRTCEWQWGIGARFGYRYTCCPFQFGLTYQTTTVFSQTRHHRDLIPGGGEISLPQELGVGCAYTLSCLTLTADVVELFWRDSRFFKNARDANGPLGANDGPGLGWSNMTVVKLGAALQLNCWTLRVGYNYGDRHHATTGVTYKRGANQFSFSYLHGFSGENRLGLSYGRCF